jgi:hypothetical protein
MPRIHFDFKQPGFGWILDAVVMALVGHDAVRHSDHYSHVGKEALVKAAAALPKKL